VLVDANVLLYAVDEDSPSTSMPVAGSMRRPAGFPNLVEGHRDLLGRLIIALDLHGNLVSDAALAALCLEHGLQMVSAESDFARFTDVTWVNPVSR
jgi:predicted nucleic acid-binding protein